MSIHVGEKGGEVREEKKGGGRGRKATEFLGEGRRRRQILEHRSLAPANNRRHVICFHLLFLLLPSFRSQPFLFVWFFFFLFPLIHLWSVSVGNQAKKSQNTSDLLPHLNRSNNPDSDSNGLIGPIRKLANEVIGPSLSFLFSLYTVVNSNLFLKIQTCIECFFS